MRNEELTQAASASVLSEHKRLLANGDTPPTCINSSFRLFFHFLFFAFCYYQP
jgi:hypothetical protein